MISSDAANWVFTSLLVWQVDSAMLFCGGRYTVDRLRLTKLGVRERGISESAILGW